MAQNVEREQESKKDHTQTGANLEFLIEEKCKKLESVVEEKLYAHLKLLIEVLNRNKPES